MLLDDQTSGDKEKSNGFSLRNLTITQKNLYLLLPSKMSWIASMLAEDKGISIVEAMKIAYSSKLYARLADEKTKLWHLGPVALYEDLQEELNEA